MSTDLAIWKKAGVVRRWIKLGETTLEESLLRREEERRQCTFKGKIFLWFVNYISINLGGAGEGGIFCLGWFSQAISQGGGESRG